MKLKGGTQHKSLWSHHEAYKGSTQYRGIGFNILKPKGTVIVLPCAITLIFILLCSLKVW